jgi:hypothetical protein
MNKTLSICLLLVLATPVIGKAQQRYMHLPGGQLSFYDNQSDSSKATIHIDATQPGNVWQIGDPHKTLFNASYINNCQVLITDTTSTYPSKNISSFTIGLIWFNAHPGAALVQIGMQITHKYDMDSLSDGGKIEYKCRSSYPNWTNAKYLFVGGVKPNFYAFPDSVKALASPGFSGRMLSWQSLQLAFPYIQVGDTAFFRFTFASDSIDNHREGWMIGNLFFNGMYEGIKEYRNDQALELSPNPANSFIQINIKLPYSGALHCVLTDVCGRNVFTQDLRGENPQIDCSSLPPGLYTLVLSTNEFITNKKIIITHE